MSLSFISTSYSLCPSSVYDHEGRGLGLTCRYGSGLKAATKKDVPGLYYSLNKPMGNSTGLRQYYRYGIYSEFPHSLLPHPNPFSFMEGPAAPFIRKSSSHPSCLPELLPSGQANSRRLRIPERRSWSMQFHYIRIPLRTP